MSFKFNQNSHIKDCEGNYIKQGNIVEFIDRHEWYRCSKGLPSKQEVLSDIEKYPRILRTIDLPSDYEWLLSSEVQSYWKVVK